MYFKFEDEIAFSKQGNYFELVDQVQDIVIKKHCKIFILEPKICLLKTIFMSPPASLPHRLTISNSLSLVKYDTSTKHQE